jgi:hypothetical protein
MPTFEDDISVPQPIKMIYLGHTGAGKTGSTVALAAAGYNVRILDLEKGTEIIRGYVKDSKSIYLKSNPGHWTSEQCSGLAKRISRVTIDDGYNVIKSPKGTELVPKGEMWGKVSEQLNDWKDPPQASLGNIDTWTEKDVLVIDSLTRLSQAAFNFQLKLGGRLMGRPEQGDYGLAQRAITRFLELLYSDSVKCNVILICHITFIETEAGPTRGFPETIGNKISPKVGQYFNHALLAKAQGSGDKASRVIVTNTSGMIELKSAAPLRVKPEYPLETGLADYFRDVKG